MPTGRARQSSESNASGKSYVPKAPGQNAATTTIGAIPSAATVDAAKRDDDDNGDWGTRAMGMWTLSRRLPKRGAVDAP